MPDNLSAIVPEIVTGTIFPSGGQSIAGFAETVSTGGVLSMLIPFAVDVAGLPARSVQTPLTDCPAPSEERTVGAGGLPAAKPERLSAHVKLIVTLLLFHPLVFGAGERAARIVGGVVSMLISLIVVVDGLPAKSTHVPVADCPAPSADKSVGAGGLPAAKPDNASAHWKVAVTAVLFQPLAFGAGVREPVMMGGVLSSRMVRVFGASTLPALSVLKNETVVIPSVLNTNAAELPFAVVTGIAWAPVAL
jgi:hypothetical protein